MVPLNGQLIDSHCHLDLEPLASERSGILSEAVAVGVGSFVVPGVHPHGWSGIAALAASDPRIYPAFGVHPMHADCVDDHLLGHLRQLVPKGIAMGEIGLDPAYLIPMAVQERALRSQLRIAVDAGMPLLIHCRQAFQRLITILREENAHRVGGIMHAFSGSVEMAREFIRLGFAISISGTVTWDGARKPVRIATELPLEHLVLESDAPDLTPGGHRGEWNRPAWLTETAERVAGLRGVSPQLIATDTSATVRRVLRMGLFTHDAVL